MEQVTQEFPSDVRQLAGIRTLVRQVCDRAWKPSAEEDTIAQLQLAVDEAAANIVLHAYEGRTDATLEATVAADADGVCVTLFHQGRPFDPQAVAPPSFDGSRETGFGLYIIRSAVDNVTFFQDDRGRHGIRLEKKRKK